MDSAKTAVVAAPILRRGTASDTAVLGRICYEAFAAIANQHNFPEDFPNVETATGLISMLLGRPDVYSTVAELDGQVLGSNFLWEMDKIVGVGPITVDPQAQNSSVGRRLMADVIEHGESNSPMAIRLVQAAYHNRSLSLYTKLGFDVVEPLSLVQGTPPNKKIDGRNVQPMTEADLPAVDALCKTVHGHTRHNEVAGAIAMGTARVVTTNGIITGYSTGIGFFGHAVGRANDDLIALISMADSYAGPGFLLPTRNGEALRWCLENGLRIVQPMSLMSRGFYQEPNGAFLPSILF